MPGATVQKDECLDINTQGERNSQVDGEVMREREKKKKKPDSAATIGAIATATAGC